MPEVNPETYELEIEVEGTDRTLSFTLEALKKLPKTTITATLMCSGNRRSDMTKVCTDSILNKALSRIIV